MIVETKVSASEFASPGHPDDKQVGYIRVPPKIAKASAARSMMELVAAAPGEWRAPRREKRSGLCGESGSEAVLSLSLRSVA